MSIRARDAVQAKPQPRDPNRPLIHRFSQARKIACQALGISYGDVGVDGCHESRHSVEMGSRRDSTVFLDPHVCYQEREDKRARRDALHQVYGGGR
jgi:hypothetical protein